jgi:hypothetical protein
MKCLLGCPLQTGHADSPRNLTAFAAANFNCNYDDRFVMNLAAI